MWASVTVCADKRLFRIASLGTDWVFYPVRKEWEEGGGKKTAFNRHTKALPIWVFPGFFLTELSHKQSFFIFRYDVHRTPPWNQKPVCACSVLEEETTGSSGKWDIGQPQQYQQPQEDWGTCWKTHQLQKEGFMPGLNRTRKETEFEVGEGKRNSVESRNFQKQAVSTSTWG